MPTGYTAGILDGTITTFKEYAEKCSRAFVVHMRDEPHDAKWKPREVSSYYQDKIDKYKEKYISYQNMSDDEITELTTKNLEEDKKKCIKKNIEFYEQRDKIESFLEQTKAFKAPTSDHSKIAEFMIQQIESTIDFDFSINYYENKLKEVDEELKNINPRVIRSDVMKECLEELDYNKDKLNEDKKMCKEHNDWYYQFMESLDE